MSQLIEIEGRYYQEAEIVMLTTKYGKITLHDYDNLKTLSLAQGNHKGTENTIIPQHLYIVSNEEIKEGDWYIDDTNTIRQSITSDKDYWAVRQDYKKIITTTNTFLYALITQDKPFDELPQPSDSFIKKYIEEYNKGNIITNVLVEYRKAIYEDWIKTAEPVKDSVKVDSNNCITIKKVEPELYTREEVEILITNAFKAGYERSHSGYPYTDNWSKPKVEEFLKENL